MVNGKTVCDGDTVSTIGLTQCQSTPLDQQSSATEELGSKKTEEAGPSAANEQSSTDLIDEAVTTWIEEPPAPSVKDTEGERRSDHQDYVQDPRQNKGEQVDWNMSSIENKKRGYIYFFSK